MGKEFTRIGFKASVAAAMGNFGVLRREAYGDYWVCDLRALEKGLLLEPLPGESGHIDRWGARRRAIMLAAKEAAK